MNTFNIFLSGFQIQHKSLALKFTEFMNYKFKSFLQFPIFCRLSFSVLTSASDSRATFSFGNMLSNHKILRAHLYLFDPHSAAIVRWRRIKDCRAFFYNSIPGDFHCHDILRNFEKRILTSNSSSHLRQSPHDGDGFV